MKTNVQNDIHNVRNSSGGKGVKHLLNNLVTIRSPKITYIKSIIKIRPIFDKCPGQSLQIDVNYRKWVENERFVQVLHRKRPFLRSIQA